MTTELELAVEALLAHDKTTGIFDDAGEIREEYEEGNWVAHPLKSQELQAIIARIEAALPNSDYTNQPGSYIAINEPAKPTKK